MWDPNDNLVSLKAELTFLGIDEEFKEFVVVIQEYTIQAAGFHNELKCLQQMRILAVRSIHSNHFVPNGLEGGWLGSWIALGVHEFEDFNSAYFHCCLVPDVEGIGDGNNCTFFKHDLPT